MNLLISASFIASFFAGIAALFAPCCITVLLPSYFTSIFKEKKTIFLMTFIYFLGLLSVFLPIGLGATFLTGIFSIYHDDIFILGGIFLIFLGITLLSGKDISLPFTVHPRLKNNGFLSVFVLGIFSAVATTCCAPVLAGVLTLSALPGSIFLGGIYTLSYVLGMVVPLFIIALFLDRVDFTKKFLAMRKTISYKIWDTTVNLSISQLFSGIMFVTLGIIILFLARTGQISSHSSYQLTVNLTLSDFIKRIDSVTSFIPEAIWGALFIFLFLLIVFRAVNELIRL